MKLDNINLEPGIIYETIVTTLNPTNQPNAAAIGMHRVDDKLKLRLFEGSNTYNNLKTNNTFGINILEKRQYAIAVQAALKGWGNDEPEFELSEYEHHDSIPFLRSSKCWIVGKIDNTSLQDLTDEYGTTQIMEVVTEVQDLILHERIDTPLTRNDDLPLLEAAVLATRYKVAEGETRQRIKAQIDDILSDIDNEIELMDLLTRFLNKW